MGWRSPLSPLQLGSLGCPRRWSLLGWRRSSSSSPPFSNRTLGLSLLGRWHTPPASLKSNLCENTHGRFLACSSLETELRKILYSSKKTVGQFCSKCENFEVNWLDQNLKPKFNLHPPKTAHSYLWTIQWSSPSISVERGHLLCLFLVQKHFWVLSGSRDSKIFRFLFFIKTWPTQMLGWAHTQFVWLRGTKIFYKCTDGGRGSN